MATDADIDGWVDEPREGLILALDLADGRGSRWHIEGVMSLRSAMDKLRKSRREEKFIAVGEPEHFHGPVDVEFVWAPAVVGFRVRSWGRAAESGRERSPQPGVHGVKRWCTFCGTGPCDGYLGNPCEPPS